MIPLRHTCGEAINYSRHDLGLVYEARFYAPETQRRVHCCPRCEAGLYGALVAGQLLDFEPIRSSHYAQEQTPWKAHNRFAKLESK